MASWGVLPTGCTTRCHCSVRAESLQSQTQLRAGFDCPPPPRGPWFPRVSRDLACPTCGCCRD